MKKSKVIMLAVIITIIAWAVTIYVFSKPKEYWEYDHCWTQPLIEFLFIPSIIIVVIECINAFVALIYILVSAIKKIQSRSK